MLRTRFRFAAMITVSAAAFVVGCGQKTPPAPAIQPAPAGGAATTNAEHGHGHGAGPHDGTLADWGGGKYHVEFTVDHGKQEATIYILGSDEKSATPVKAENVLLTITDPSLQVELLPVPLPGEAGGLASRFVGKHEGLGKVQEFAGTISAEVDGTPFAGDFKEEPHGDHDHK